MCNDSLTAVNVGLHSVVGSGHGIPPNFLDAKCYYHSAFSFLQFEEPLYFLTRQLLALLSLPDVMPWALTISPLLCTHTPMLSVKQWMQLQLSWLVRRLHSPAAWLSLLLRCRCDHCLPCGGCLICEM